MNKLKLGEDVCVLGVNISVIDGVFKGGGKSILIKDISFIHDIKIKYINELINNNRYEFEDEVDIIDLKKSMVTNHPLLKRIFTKTQISNYNNIYVLSEQGYIKLYYLFKNKNEEIFKGVMEDYFKSDVKVIGFAHNKESRFVEMLKDILLEMGIESIPQYNVLGSRIDLYIPILKIAIEYDEDDHNKYTYDNHEGRQIKIEKELGCKFIRVTDEYSIGKAIGIVLKNIKGMVI